MNGFMLINNLNLFFNSAIVDRYHLENVEYQGVRRSCSTLAEDCEIYADAFLAETRYWLGGKNIEILGKFVVVAEEKRQFITLIDKIKSAVTAIFLFIPGIVLKSLTWVIRPIKVCQRNQLILENLKQQKQCVQRSDTQLHKLLPKVFDVPEKGQASNVLSDLPIDIKLHVLSFLKNNDRNKLALSCKQNYSLVAKFYEDTTFYEEEMYLAAITQSMEKKILHHLPHGTLPESMNTFFEHASFPYLEMTQFNISDVYKFAFPCSFYLKHAIFPDKEEYEIDLIEDIFEHMKDHAIQTIQMKGGPGFVIRLKNNLLDETFLAHKQALIITKMKGQWTVFGLNISSGMWLFLNDMRFYPDSPELIDYFTRLFNGKPCGNFSEDIQNEIEFDYKVTTAASLLQEGPRTCPDGVTPVIQLWPI